jgi:ABC-2 type transport system ATP-binding protein
LIKVTNLTKSYGDKLALDNVSFTVNKGEVLGFLGPNGAGKSTTMNIITGYISYTSGSVSIDGVDILENPKEAKRKIGYLPELPPLYLDMTVTDYLNFVYDLKKVAKENKNDHINEILNLVKIDNVKGRKIANLSKGYKQRVGLAGALIGDPEVLILDEPTVGLDPKQIIEIRNVIKELGKERTIILSSHILSEISAVCERVIIINQGKIVAEDTPENLSKNIGPKQKLMLRVSGDEKEIENVLSSIEHITNITALGAYDETSFDFEIEVDTELNSEFNKQLFFAFAEKCMPIVMQQKVEASLEDIFLQVTEKSDNQEINEEIQPNEFKIEEEKNEGNIQ